MIQLTDRAASQIRNLTSQGDPNRGLRLFVEKGGCAGSSYGMAVTLPEPTDEKIDQNGARLFIAAESAPLLEACKSEANLRVRNLLRGLIFVIPLDSA